jgi:hypothetical protein
MVENEKQKRQVIPFVRQFSNISIQDLELILEQLHSWDYFNKEGLAFRKEFWKLLIKK